MPRSGRSRLPVRCRCGRRRPGRDARRPPMATASRSTGAKQRTKPPVAAMIAADALRTWVIPVTAAAAIVLFAAGSATGIMPTLPALAGAIVATLILLLYVGERPLIAEQRPARDRAFGALLAVTWF